MSDKIVVIEVEGGVAEVTYSDVGVVILDWDNLDTDEHASWEVLTEQVPHLPADVAEAVRARIVENFPELVYQCDECGGCGYLVNQEYGRHPLPNHCTPVQRCDTCRRLDSDMVAAQAYVLDLHEERDATGWSDGPYVVGWHAPRNGSSVIATAGDVWVTYSNSSAAGPILVDDSEERES